MAFNSNFVYRGVTPKAKKTTTVTRFLGVDYSTQKFNIANGRAIDLSNFIYKDGVMQKRNGYEELYKVKPFEYVRKNYDGSLDTEVSTNGVCFHGLWRFLAEDNEYHIVAHIGKLLYEIKNLDKWNMSIEPISNETTKISSRFYYACYEQLDARSFAVVGGNKLWFASGKKWLCIRFLASGFRTITVVENSTLAPIPTTTQSITYEDARNSGRASLDNVNLLQKFRKNKLISGIGKVEGKEEDTKYVYNLDAPLIWENENEDMAQVKIVIKHRGSV